MKHLDAALTSFANWIVLQLLSVLTDEVPATQPPHWCEKCGRVVRSPGGQT